MAKKRATRDALIARRAGVKTEDVELDGVGTVTVRGLTRWEMITVFDLDGQRHKQEQRAVSMGMIDPQMTTDDVAEWQKSAESAELDKVAATINRLSGIGKGADKSVVSGDGERPDA